MNILSTMFNSVFNMTRLGVILFLVILIGRYMLSRFPKIYSYILWAALFIRLIIPINLNIHPSLFTLKIIIPITHSIIAIHKIYSILFLLKSNASIFKLLDIYCGQPCL